MEDDQMAKKGLDNHAEIVKLPMTFTTVYPLAVVSKQVRPGVPPNAGLFFYTLVESTYRGKSNS